VNIPLSQNRVKGLAKIFSTAESARSNLPLPCCRPRQPLFNIPSFCLHPGHYECRNHWFGRLLDFGVLSLAFQARVISVGDPFLAVAVGYSTG
jgi:hypothetical protein